MSQPTTQGQRIRQLRREKRYTMEYLAQMLGTTKQSIYKYENDIVRNIPADKLRQLALLLGCTPAWLQGFDSGAGSAAAAPGLSADAAAGRAAAVPADASDASPEALRLYRDLTDTLLRLTPAELRSMMDFAQFLLARRTGC